MYSFLTTTVFCTVERTWTTDLEEKTSWKKSQIFFYQFIRGVCLVTGTAENKAIFFTTLKPLQVFDRLHYV